MMMACSKLLRYSSVILLLCVVFAPSTLAVNLLNNSGFENATNPTYSWLLNPMSEMATIVAANGSVINGTASMKIIKPAGALGIGELDQVVTSFSAGALYTASAFINMTNVTALGDGSAVYVYVTYNSTFLAQATFYTSGAANWGNYTNTTPDIIYLYTNPFVIPATATTLNVSIITTSGPLTSNEIIVDNVALTTENVSGSNESSLWEIRSFPFNRPNAIDYGTYVLYNRTFSGVNKYCLWGDQFCLLYLLNATYRTISYIETTPAPPQICLSGTTLCTDERLDYFIELGTTKKYEEGGFVLFYNDAIYSRPYSEYIDRLVYTKVRADTNTCYFWNSFTATNRGLSIPSTNSVYWGLSPMTIGTNQAFLYSPLGFECFNPTNITITLEFWDPHTAVHLFDKNVSVPVGYKLYVNGTPDYTQPLDCALNATLCGGGTAGGGGGGGTGATDIDKIVNAFFQPKNIVLITFIGLSVAAAGIGGAFLGLIAFGGFMMIGLMMGVVDFWIALLLVIMDGLGLAALLSKIF